LLRAGFQKGDMLASVIVKNRPEWLIADLGMQQVGVIHVPVYPTISPAEYEYIFSEAKVRACLIGDDAQGSIIKKVRAAQANVPTLTHLYTFDATEGCEHWQTLLDENDARLQQVADMAAAIDRHELATIIYTSGTTGQPKGVMLSHWNIVSNIQSVMPLIPLGAGDCALSFLPLNHIYERVDAYAYLSAGVNIVFTGIENLGGDDGDLKSVRPHFFATVPRLLEKVYERIYQRGSELRGIKRAIFFWALRLADDYEYDRVYNGWRGLQKHFADRFVFSKWREALGGNIKGIVVAASPCPVKIMRVFNYAGIPVREGYGMTETSPGIAIGRFQHGQALIGTVGPIVDGVTVRIDSSDGSYAEGEGEIIMTGENVMLGYYQQAEKTAEVIKIIDNERWILTGDIGKLVESNGVQFLKITDRKKELFKTSGGKYVAPAPIENKLREHILIEQAMIVGDGQKFVSALLTPAPDALKEFCKQHNIVFNNLAQACTEKQVLQKYQEIIDRYNPNFAHVEQIKAFRLLPDQWEALKPDGSDAELTPTMKLKRRVIAKRYAAVIAAIYEA
jgi:long-chain acyl-CoA synthetase